MKKQSGIIQLIPLFIIAIVVIVVLFVAKQNQTITSPTPITNQETEGWKTYINTEYGYKTTYPSGWEVVETKSTEKNVASLPSTEILFESKGEIQKVTFLENQDVLWPGQLEIVIFSNPNNLNLEQWVSSLKFEAATGANLVKEVIDTNLGEKPAKKMVIFSFDSYDAKIISALSNNIIQISFTNDTPNDPDLEKHTAIYDQILSTFEFLENINEPIIEFPKANSKVTSPLTVKGKIPSGWAFEDVFGLKLLDADRNVIAQPTARLKVPGAWQNPEPAEIEVTFEFTTSAANGYLVISSDNPSGLPENEKSYEIPVQF